MFALCSLPFDEADMKEGNTFARKWLGFFFLVLELADETDLGKTKAMVCSVGFGFSFCESMTDTAQILSQAAHGRKT